MVGSNAKELTGEHPGISFKDLKEAHRRLWVRDSESPIKKEGYRASHKAALAAPCYNEWG